MKNEENFPFRAKKKSSPSFQGVQEKIVSKFPRRARKNRPYNRIVLITKCPYNRAGTINYPTIWSLSTCEKQQMNDNISKTKNLVGAKEKFLDFQGTK